MYSILCVAYLYGADPSFILSVSGGRWGEVPSIFTLTCAVGEKGTSHPNFPCLQSADVKG